MSRLSCLLEEDIIDLILNNQPDALAQRMHTHIAQCLHCHAQFKQWSDVLDAAAGPSSPATTVESTADAKTTVEATRYPPAHLRQKLHKRMSRFHWKRRLTSHSHLFYPVAVCAAFCLVFMTVMAFISSPHAGPLVEEETGDHEYSFILHPQTQPYKVVPAEPLHANKGSMWINYDSGELLVSLEGLPPLAHGDYQVWLMHHQRPVTIGLLEFDNGNAYLYAHELELHPRQQVRISIEPKGGSRQPDGPEAITVPLYAPFR